MKEGTLVRLGVFCIFLAGVFVGYFCCTNGVNTGEDPRDPYETEEYVKEVP